MNAIINSKNALSALFLIPILKSAIAMAVPKEGNSVTLGLIYMFLYLVVGLACFYLAKTDNEYITSKSQRIGMYILSAYNIVLDVIVWRLLVLINEDWSLINLLVQLCGDMSIGATIGGIIYSIFDLTYVVAFLMFIWGIPASKSYKSLITTVFFIPLILSVIISLLTATAENTADYGDLIIKTFNIMSDGLMFYLVFKAYKRKNEIE